MQQTADAEFAAGNATINSSSYFNFNNQYYTDNNRFSLSPDFSNDNAVSLYLNGAVNSIVGGVTKWTFHNDGIAGFASDNATINQFGYFNFANQYYADRSLNLQLRLIFVVIMLSSLCW